jgi:hypothetical protein
MRLLERKNDEFSLTEFVGDNIPQYAILSHTWGDDSQEVNFKDLVKGAGKSKAGVARSDSAENKLLTTAYNTSG